MPISLACRRSATLALAGLLACAPISARDTDRELRLRRVDGAAVAPLDPDRPVRARVFVFVSTSCPISSRYAPELRRLRTAFAGRGVEFWLVFPNPAESPDEIAAHLAAFGLDPAWALRDPEQTLARRASATMTPEAAVFDARPRQVYRGRIDDRYLRIGVERRQATTHDLEDAIRAILDGRPVANPVTQAVGCFIADFVP